MVSVCPVAAVEATAATPPAAESTASPRISFSTDLPVDCEEEEDEEDESFISISPTSSMEKDIATMAEFDFLASKNSLDGSHTMLTADELFFEGKLLPFWQKSTTDKLNKICLKSNDCHQDKNNKNSSVTKEINGDVRSEHHYQQQQEPRIWFIDDDPSPRPPKCTVLWKELLRLKKNNKQRVNSSLSPSSSSSSSSSCSSSLGDAAAMEERENNERGDKEDNNKNIRKIKKGLERTRSASTSSGSLRIRPMVNVPICTTPAGGIKSSSLPPLFPLKKGRLDSR